MENPNIDEIYEAYVEYFSSCADADCELRNRVLDFEYDYFHDMTFQVDSILRDYLQYEVADEDGVFHPSHPDICDKLSSLSNAYCRFYVGKLPPHVGGQYNPRDRTMTIVPEHADDPAVIMHEMIHAYEDILSGESDIYRDILFMCLYKDLSGKIDDLDSRILDHSHIFGAEVVYSRGGPHGILFFLKSLDLDLRCGYKLGTVCGYGRDSFNAPDDATPPAENTGN